MIAASRPCFDQGMLSGSLDFFETISRRTYHSCSVAGRVLLRRKDGRLSHELVRIDRPIMRIPTLAIHLDRNVNTEGFKPNLETHLAPVLATAIKAEVDGGKSDGKEDAAKKTAHHPLLLQV